MASLGQLSAFTNTSTLTVYSTYHCHTEATRQHSHVVFWYSGRRICKNTFLFLDTISDKRLHNVQESLQENGLVPRRRGNAHRLPVNTISFDDTQKVVQFLHTYAEANAILFPGRIPGYKCSDVQLLPSSTIKRQSWE